MYERPAYTISNSMGKCSEEHSRRSYTPFSAEKSLAPYNIIIYDCGDDRKHLNDSARPFIRNYNSLQKRRDRRKDYEDDYVAALEDGRACFGKGDKKEKPFHSDVIQIGNRDDLGVTDSDFDVRVWRRYRLEGKEKEAASYVKKHLNKDPRVQEAIQILKEVAEEIAEGKYSNILVHGLIIHADEPNGTPHLDFRYSVFTENETRGVSWRISDNKGLGKMGFVTEKKKSDGKGNQEVYTALQKFRESINSRIEEKMDEHGWQRKYLHEHRKHLSTAQYVAERTLADAELKSKQMMDEAEDLYDEYMEEIEIGKRKLEKEKQEFIEMRKNLSEFLSSDIAEKAYREYAAEQIKISAVDSLARQKKKQGGKISAPKPELNQELKHIDDKFRTIVPDEEKADALTDVFDEFEDNGRSDAYE